MVWIKKIRINRILELYEHSYFLIFYICYRKTSKLCIKKFLLLFFFFFVELINKNKHKEKKRIIKKKKWKI